MLGILWVAKQLWQEWGAYVPWQPEAHRLHSTGPFLLLLGIVIGIGIGIILLGTVQIVDYAVEKRSVIKPAVGIIFVLVFIYFVLLGWGRCEQLVWRSVVTLAVILLIASYAVLVFNTPTFVPGKTIGVALAMALASAIYPLICCNIFYVVGRFFSTWNKDFKKEPGSSSGS